jgi:two-component system, LytTR family, response regulator
MLRAIIIDDVDTIRHKNKLLIQQHCPNVTIIAEANNMATGVKAIKQYVPDLVFLDVEMPDGTGFDLLQKLVPITFKVIFITGFEDFAVKAFRFSAIDYLLKPIDSTDLVNAVNKAEEVVNKDTLELKFSTLFSNIERPKNLQKLVLKTAEKVYSINVQDIVHCEADKNYTTFNFVNAPKIIVSTTLKEYETLLVPHGFFRSHQSHLINMLYFDHFIKADSGTIVLKNNVTIPLSVRRRDEFIALIDNL